MIWIITKRCVLKKIHKIRWYGENLASVGNSTQTDWERYNRGILSTNLETKFFNEFVIEIKNKKTINFIIYVFKFIIPYYDKYIEKFMSRVRNVIDILKEENYLREAGGHFTLTSKGEDMVKWYYWLKVLFENHYFKKAFDWVLPAIVLWLLAHYLKANISIKP